MKNLLIPSLAIISLGFTPVSAQQKKENKKEDKKVVVVKRDDDRHHDGMKLSEEQQKKMDEIHGKTQKETVVIKNQIAEKKAHLKTLMSMDKPDMNDVNKTVDEMESLRSQVMKKELAAKIETRSLLTEEQKAMMSDMDEFGGDMEGHRFMLNMGDGDGNMMFFRTGDDGREERKVIRKRIKIDCDDEGHDD